MSRSWQLLASFVLVAALATSGYAGSGSGKGGNKDGRAKKEKREGKRKGDKKHGWSHDHETSASLSIGQIIATDDRILDLTGDYVLSGEVSEPTSGVATLALSLVQDERGRLVGESLVTLPDGSATTVTVSGELDLSGRRNTELSFSLAGSIGDDDDDWWEDHDDWDDWDDDDRDDRHARSHRRDDDDDDDSRRPGHHDDDRDEDDEDDDDHDEDDDDDDGGDWDVDGSDDDSDDDDITTSVRVHGEWDGTAFDTDVIIRVGDDTYRFEALLVPVNPLRGFTIEPATESMTVGRGKVTFSERTVLLPWGTETGRALEINSRKGFKFKMHDGDFRADLRGKVDSSGNVTVYRAKVEVGYGDLELDPESVTVLPAIVE